MQSKLYNYSSSPHIKAPKTTKWIMINVCIALLPSAIMGMIYFGAKALLLIALSVISAILSEYVYLLIAGKKTKQIIKEFDFTSCVTGLLVGMSVGVNYPWYSVILGSVFSIVVVKMFFGGTGKNLVNPAICGRIFIFISFQSIITGWVLPNGNIVTGATTLAGMLESSSAPANLTFWDMLLGTNLAGCIGETCKLALIIGAIYLAIIKVIDIKLPLIYIAVTGLFQVAICGFNFSLLLPSIFTGGLIMGAFFMATDYVTTPNTKWGNIIYFIMLGLLTAGLRVATKMEAVSFAILLMNLIVPLIDKFVIVRPFGYIRKKGGKNI